MGAMPLALPADLENEQLTPTAGISDRSNRDSTSGEDDRQRELVKCLVLQLAMCGAFINRDTIDFARGIAEILIWSADHARSAADAKPSAHDRPLAEWQCDRCGESVPGNFELCWNCELDRPVP